MTERPDAGSSTDIGSRLTLHGVGTGDSGDMPVVTLEVATGEAGGSRLVHLPLPEAKALVAAVDRVASGIVRSR